MPKKPLLRETLRAKHALADYLAMGPGRSLERLWEQYRVQSASKTCPTNRLNTLKEWSAAWHWQGRAAEWELERAREFLDKRKAELEAMRERHLQMLTTLEGKAVQRLQTLEAKELSPAEMRRFFMDAMNMERLTRGQPTEIVGVPDEELDRLIEEEFERRAGKLA